MRLELRDMVENHPDQWNLFLLGLERFQKVDEKEPLSYFQIAGKMPPSLRYFRSLSPASRYPRFASPEMAEC